MNVHTRRSAASRKIRGMKLVLAAAAGIAIAGCTVGPDYKTPPTTVPSSYGEAPTTQPAASIAWWTTFNDPILDRLVAQTRDNNLDLKAAEARIRQARAERGIAASAYYPQISGDANYSRFRNSRGITAQQSNLVPTEEDSWVAGFDATWEIDVFGGTRRSVEAAKADIQASIADRNDVLLSLQGEVARTYVDLRGAQRQIIIAQENITAQEQTLDLTKAKLRAGLANDLDVARQEAQVQSTESQIPLLQTRAAQDMHQLSILMAQEPSALNELLGPPQDIPAPPPAVPVGLPSDLLRRRPDIRRAERQLAAATARIGVAVAQLYPQFTIDGSLGVSANPFRDWTSSSSTFWSIGPGVTVPIFTGGRLRSGIEVQKALTDQALDNYQQTVLNSLAEVEDDLVAYQKEFIRRQSLANAVSANQRSVSLSQQLYQQGLRDFINVLDAQRALYESQDALVLSDTQVSANAVALFKALGGGWEIDTPDASAEAGQSEATK